MYLSTYAKDDLKASSLFFFKSKPERAPLREVAAAAAAADTAGAGQDGAGVVAAAAAQCVCVCVFVCVCVCASTYEFRDWDNAKTYTLHLIWPSGAECLGSSVCERPWE